jgi:hypothetical protein
MIRNMPVVCSADDDHDLDHTTYNNNFVTNLPGRLSTAVTRLVFILEHLSSNSFRNASF